MFILSDKDPCGWPMRRFLFLFLLSISGILKFVNIKKIQFFFKKIAHVNTKHGKKITKKNIENTEIRIKFVGGGGGSSLFPLSDL